MCGCAYGEREEGEEGGGGIGLGGEWGAEGGGVGCEGGGWRVE